MRLGKMVRCNLSRKKLWTLIEFCVLICSANEFRTRWYSQTGSKQLMRCPREESFVWCLERTGRVLKLWQSPLRLPHRSTGEPGFRQNFGIVSKDAGL